MSFKTYAEMPEMPLQPESGN